MSNIPRYDERAHKRRVKTIAGYIEATQRIIKDAHNSVARTGYAYEVGKVRELAQSIKTDLAVVLPLDKLVLMEHESQALTDRVLAELEWLEGTTLNCLAGQLLGATYAAAGVVINKKEEVRASEEDNLDEILF